MAEPARPRPVSSRGQARGQVDDGPQAPEPARGAGSGDDETRDGRGERTGAVTVLRRLECARPDSRVIHVLPGNARQHHAKAPVPFPERPDRRVRPRFLPPYAPHLNPTGRLWGVMHRHVRRNRFHADLRRFTGAILRFFDGTLPREREAIAESVTGSFRVITHDGYRMAAYAAAAMRRRANQPVRYGPVQRVSFTSTC